MNFKKFALGAVTAMALSSMATLAGAVGLAASNQGGNSVIANVSGNLAGLFTIVRTSVGEQLDLAGVQSLQTSGFGITDILAGDPTSFPPPGFQSGGIELIGGGVPNAFDNVNAGIEVTALSSGTSVFDALFIVFDTPFSTTGVIGTFSNGNGGVNTFAVNGNSIDVTSAVPVPAALPLMAGALGVFGLVGWRRRVTTM